LKEARSQKLASFLLKTPTSKGPSMKYTSAIALGALFAASSLKASYPAQEAVLVTGSVTQNGEVVSINTLAFYGKKTALTDTCSAVVTKTDDAEVLGFAMTIDAMDIHSAPYLLVRMGQEASIKYGEKKGDTLINNFELRINAHAVTLETHKVTTEENTADVTSNEVAEAEQN
jgi:hypothetical protein